MPWVVIVVLAGAVAAAYPSARSYVAERRAPEVELARVTQIVAAPGGSTALPVLVATGYVVARRSSDVGVKTGGRVATLEFEGGTRVRQSAGVAGVEHAGIDAQLQAAGPAPPHAGAGAAPAAAARARGHP